MYQKLKTFFFKKKTLELLLHGHLLHNIILVFPTLRTILHCVRDINKVLRHFGINTDV